MHAAAATAADALIERKIESLHAHPAAYHQYHLTHNIMGGFDRKEFKRMNAFNAHFQIPTKQNFHLYCITNASCMHFQIPLMVVYPVMLIEIMYKLMMILTFFHIYSKTLILIFLGQKKKQLKPVGHILLFFAACAKSYWHV
ncbi:hypothetical protein ACJX0J_021841, partial [Zea mays]